MLEKLLLSLLFLQQKNTFLLIDEPICPYMKK